MTGTIPAMRMIRTAITGILTLLAAAASAQTPQFPQTLPANTVWGRLGISAGPPQAIPFATLLSNLSATQSANKVWAGPVSGAATLPTWRLLVGADIPGADQNILNSQTANYTIATTDCGSRIQAGTGSTGIFTVTLPAVTSFATNCRVSILNGDTGRGKKLSGFPTGAPAILYPKQEIGVAIVNGAWSVVTPPKRWVLTAALTINVDPTNGSDTNDGLATGSGNALATLQKAWNTAADSYDCGGNNITILGTNSTYSAGIVSDKMPVGCWGAASMTVNLQGGTISTTSADAIGFGQGNGYGGCASATLTNMTLQTTTSGMGIDVQSACSVVVAGAGMVYGAVAGNHIYVGHGGYFLATNAYTISGSAAAGAGYHAFSYSGGILFVEGAFAVTCTGSPAFLGFAGAQESTTSFNGISFSGCGTATGARFVAANNGTIIANGDLNFLPGNAAGSVSGAGVYVGSTVSSSLPLPPLILGGSAAVNFNTTNTDHAITITSPTTNYKIDQIVVINTGTTASLTTATAGVFTAPAAGGTAVVAAGTALSPITSNAANTASSALALGGPAATAVVQAYYNAATLYFRMGTAQGAAATGTAYVYIRPLP